jgi:hypothetical protein
MDLLFISYLKSAMVVVGGRMVSILRYLPHFLLDFLVHASTFGFFFFCINQFMQQKKLQVQWKGYMPKQDTWEPIENLRLVPRLFCAQSMVV